MPKKYSLPAICLLLCILLAACSAAGKPKGNRNSQEENIQESTQKDSQEASSESTWQGGAPDEGLAALAERTEYYDLTVKREEIFDLGLQEQNSQSEHPSTVIYSGGTAWTPLGTQFYQGEPVQLWAETSSNGTDVYLYRKDKSRELLLESVPNDYTTTNYHCQWYLDRSGDFYCSSIRYPKVQGEYRAQCSWVKILSTGEILTPDTLETGIVIDDFCQTEDGRMYLLLRDEDNTRFLEEVDTATGLCIPESQVEVPLQYMVYLGNAGDAPAVTGYSLDDINRRIVKLDPSGGQTSLIVSFTGTSYEFPDVLELKDCQVLADGQIELLWTGHDGAEGLLETMKMGKVEKIPIVLRGAFWHDTWLTSKVSQFNSENDTYHVIMEDCWDGRQWEDFLRLTSVQIGAGKGPDILCGNQLPYGYIGGMLEKGALEDLTPYMEASGIQEEDYFPLTFATWRQGEHIYGVNPQMEVWSEEIEESILGSRQTPDIETLADALLALETDGVYYRNWDSGQVLNSFLQGTDSLWGMVDWENGTCQFSTPLFEKLLEAARRHGDDGRKNPESTIMHTRGLDGITYFSGQAEQEAEGRVTSGVWFDDGCYGAILPTYTLAINTNSLHKEGAWEFISFLIGEETQSTDWSWHVPPVNRKAFEAWMQWTITDLTEAKYVNGILSYPVYYGVDTSARKQEEYRKALEEARPLPMRTEPILEIILAEAKDYFQGIKSAEDVSKVVNNRVQLYLDEQR